MAWHSGKPADNDLLSVSVQHIRENFQHLAEEVAKRLLLDGSEPMTGQLTIEEANIILLHLWRRSGASNVSVQYQNNHGSIYAGMIGTSSGLHFAVADDPAMSTNWKMRLNAETGALDVGGPITANGNLVDDIVDHNLDVADPPTGWYVRYASGKQECFGNVVVFEGDDSSTVKTDLLYYPAPFSERPAVMGDAGGASWQYRVAPSATALDTPKDHVRWRAERFDSDSWSSGRMYRLLYVAKGVWK